MRLNIVILTLTILYFISPALANSMPVPVEVQGPLFVKILAFEKNLKFQAKSTVKIGIFYTNKPQSKQAKEKFLNSLNGLRKRKKTIGKLPFSVKEISNQNIQMVKNVDVLYITPDSNSYLDILQQMARKNKIITITGVPEYVTAGKISIGANLKQRNTKMFPNIMINLKVAQAEGSDFSSKLLQIADIIK